MTAIPARRRRRLIAAMVTSALSAVCLPGGLVVGANMLLNDSGGQNVASEDAIAIPVTPVHLVTIVDDSNVVASAALLALAPGGEGGTIVSFPVGARADTPADAPPRRIADSFATGGLEAFRTDVEDLLNITVDSASVHTAGELAVVLAGVGPRSITLTQPVIDTGADGSETVVLEPQVTQVSPEQLAAGLAAVRTGFDEVTRFEAHKALWGAVGAAGVAPTAPSTTIETDGQDAGTTPGDGDAAPPTGVEGYIESLLRGRIDVWQIAGTRLTDTQRNPSGADMYGLDGGEVLMVTASVAPSAMRLVSDRLAVMLDVPFDNSIYAREAVTRLAYAGANVVLVRRVPGAPAERTVAHVIDSLAAAEVATYAGLIGPVETIETLERIDGVTVRIVLGNDFAAFLGGDGATTTTVSK